MTTNHFVVSQRDSAWQFSFKGDVTAPFATKEAAIEAAITAAGNSKDANVEVTVRDADLRTETVWRKDMAKLSDDEYADMAADLDRSSDA